MKFVIVGSGPAGIAAAETIRDKLPDAAIEMITKDPMPALSPVMLTYWAGGKFKKRDISFRPGNWAEQNGVNLLCKTSVVGISTKDCNILLDKHKPISYDRLLIASGATALSLPIPGSEAKGVGFFRTFEDTESFLADRHALHTVVIIGGGFIGLKLACHLKEKGFSVVILEKENCLAARILDKAASRMITARLVQHGIQVRTGVFIEKILARNGRVHAVLLKTEENILAQRVVLAAGVRPNTKLVEKSAVQVDGGIIVNDRMETSQQGIYAAGDVAVTRDSITGEWLNNAIWPAAMRQGNIAGRNMTGKVVRYRQNFPINALELFGMRVMSAGHPMAKAGDRVTVEEKPQSGEYIKQVIRNDRLIGFIMIGKVDQAGRYLQMMKKNSPWHADARQEGNFISKQLPKGLGYGHGRMFR